MCGILETYIKQVVKKPVYSPFFSEAFTFTGPGGDLQLKRDYSEQGANLILVHNFIISIGTNTPGNTQQLVDHSGKVYFNIFQVLNMSGIYQIETIINSGRLQLTLVGSAGFNIKMTALYQYICNDNE